MGSLTKVVDFIQCCVIVYLVMIYIYHPSISHSISKYNYHLNVQCQNPINKHLPIRTKFYNSLEELLYDESYQIEVNWPVRLRTNKERIYQELKNTSAKQNIMERNKLVSELTQVFNQTLLKSSNRAKANLSIETKHYKKRVELLLPLKVAIHNND
eukprot:547803_1